MAKKKSGIGTWAEDDRPRERLIGKGASALSDAELITILIGGGTSSRSALQVARDVLALADNKLDNLGRMDVEELQKVNGIGMARAVSIAAAVELGRRRQGVKEDHRVRISDHRAAAGLLIPQLQDLEHEVFCVLYLNNGHWLVKQEIISRGGLTSTVADIRIILKKALLHNASRIIVAHNHPSGNRQPSGEDRKLTDKLKEAAALMDITLLDHLIVAGQQYTSFVNEGLL